MMRIVLALLCVAPAAATISVQQSVEEAQANPIRKVVNMLQMMSKKITAEGKKEDELFDKFMCYCKTGGSTLGTSIAEAEAKVPAVGSDLEEGADRQGCSKGSNGRGNWHQRKRSRGFCQGK